MIPQFYQGATPQTSTNPMNYNNFWTGEKQLLHASRGSHGGFVTDETRQHRFWEVFIDFC